MKVFLLIFISIILVTSVSLAINHPSFGYGGGGGGGGGGSGSTLDSRVCGDKLCSEIPGGREAWESRTNTKKVESELSNTEQVSSLSDSPRKQIAYGVSPEQVICNEGLVLFIKYNGSPACVRHDTAVILEERGWGGMPLPCCKPTDTSSIHSFEECVAAGNPVMESYPRQCRTNDGKHFVESILEFSLSYTKEGGFAGITQNISIDTQDNLIKISGFDSKTLGPISTEDTQRLWQVILENQFFELESTSYPPVEGSADYFTYTLDMVSSTQRNTISWTDTSLEFPKELVIITQEIDRQIQFYSSENS